MWHALVRTAAALAVGGIVGASLTFAYLAPRLERLLKVNYALVQDNGRLSEEVQDLQSELSRLGKAAGQVEVERVEVDVGHPNPRVRAALARLLQDRLHKTLVGTAAESVNHALVADLLRDWRPQVGGHLYRITVRTVVGSRVLRIEVQAEEIEPHPGAP